MQPWDRQPFDTDETFAFFVAYRDTPPPRQLSRVRVPGTKTPTLQTLLNWYNDGAWRDRAAAWDQHLDDLRQAEKEEATRLSARDAATADQQMVAELRTLANRELDKLIRTSLESDAEVIRPADLGRLVDQVVKLGRLTRGEATERIEAMDLSGLSLEELRALQAMKKKAGSK